MNGNYFLLPNAIFNEKLTPNEFIVYSFLVSKKDSRGQSFYSVPNIAKGCFMSESVFRGSFKKFDVGYFT